MRKTFDRGGKVKISGIISNKTILFFAATFAVIGLIMLSMSFAASGPIIDSSRFPVGFKGTTRVHTRNFGNKYAGQPSAFRIMCKYSHMSYDDPIVYPGQDNAAHLHTFFGNRTTDENTTTSSLTDPNAQTTCHGGAINKSAYWVPTLIHNGDTPLEPESMFVYYKPHDYIHGAEHERNMRPIPDNLKLIGGDPSNKTGQSLEVVSWNCNDDPNTRSNVIPQNCRSGQTIQLHIKFPNCWNGRDLDSANHRSHLRYMGSEYAVPPDSSVGGVRDFCTRQSEHNIAVPQITFNLVWRLPAGINANTLRLSSDASDAIPGASAHGDFMEGWDRNSAEIFVRDCIAAGQSCTNDLGNDTYLDDYLESTPQSQQREPAQTRVTNPGTTPPSTTDTSPPAVTITDPVIDSTFNANQTINFAASASDNVGVTRIELRVDGASIASSNNQTVFTQIPAANFGVGNHTMRATARDAAGNTSLGEVRFVIVQPPETLCRDEAANNTGLNLPCTYNSVPVEPVRDTTPPSISIINPTFLQTISG